MRLKHESKHEHQKGQDKCAGRHCCRARARYAVHHSDRQHHIALLQVESSIFTKGKVGDDEQERHSATRASTPGRFRVLTLTVDDMHTRLSGHAHTSCPSVWPCVGDGDELHMHCSLVLAAMLGRFRGDNSRHGLQPCGGEQLGLQAAASTRDAGGSRQAAASTRDAATQAAPSSPFHPF